MRKVIASLLISLFALPAFPQQTQKNTKLPNDAQTERAKTSRLNEAGESARLPVRKVVLYKNGIGYFEHAGRVRGSQDVTVEFTTSQLNDVLQSLTVLDLGDGRINGVSYNS